MDGDKCSMTKEISTTPVTQRQARLVHTNECDLCFSKEAFVLPERSGETCSLVICPECRLIYVWPQLSATALDNFYEDAFVNDPGALQRSGAAFPPDEDRHKEENLAQNWCLKIITRFINPQGKKILDLRARTGAMTSLLQSAGAEVLGVEPFQANANYARQIRELSHVYDLPFSRFHQFPLSSGGQVDVVNALNHHILAHVPSPRTLLEHIYSALTPGGYLFLDEKDVLHPVRHKKRSALDSGPAHQFQLTLHTTARYIRSTGFELVECEIDKYRSSDFRHIRIVARKPKDKSTATYTARRGDTGEGPSLHAIQNRLWWLERTWRIRLARICLTKKTHRMLYRLSMKHRESANVS
jgi:SAM-dependent methyltransferase